MPSEVVLHDQAYLKAVLHAARWPNCAVVGLLIANPLLQEEILDVLPLAHNSLSYLSPMAEAGLAVAKHHVKAQKRDVVGLYCAASRTGEDSVHPARQALAAEIARQLGKDALVLVMDNAKLASDEVPFLTYSVSSSKTLSKSPVSVSLSTPNLLSKTPALLQKPEQVDRLSDWDDHLDNFGDWLSYKVEL